MPVSADVLRTHLDYSAWASRRLLDAIAELPAEDLTRDFQTAEHSVLGTLAHIFYADRSWLWRLSGGEDPGGLKDSDRSLAVLQADWPAIQERWRLWAADLTDDQAAAMLDYRDRRGNPYRQPVWQLIFHVVNHGTHHRGQVSGFLRAMGHVPPVLDLVDYYRQMAKRAAGGSSHYRP